MKITINTPDDIAALPWAGNYADDAPLFELINEYIRREPDLAKRQQAEVHANWYGCGERVSCEGLDPRDWMF